MTTPQSSAPLLPANKPSTREISQSLKSAETPMDFILANRRQGTNQDVIITRQAPDAPIQASSIEATSPMLALPSINFNQENSTVIPEINIPSQVVPPPVQQTAEVQEPSNEPQVEPLSDAQPETPSSSTNLLDIAKKKGPEDSLKDLRRKSNELQRTVQEKETALTQAQEVLKKYETGEIEPEVVKTMKARITELEKYEQLHAFKLSPEYQKNYVEPLTQLKTQAETLANDYHVDPQVLNQALAINDKRELNTFLRAHFDDVGALEVKELLDEIKTIDSQAVQAEQAPVQTLEQLRARHIEEERGKEVRRLNTIAVNAENGWIEALREVQEQGQYPELTLLGDMEHDKISRPVIEAAASEYGKFVKLLGSIGAKDLPKDVAKILAKRFALSQAAAIAAVSRAHHHQRAEDVIKTAERTAPMMRPAVGGGVPNGNGVPQKPMTLEQAGRNLINGVLAKQTGGR